MKFGKNILDQSVPAWISHYVDYKMLKQVISRVAEVQHQHGTNEDGLVTADIVEDERNAFARELMKELDRVDAFYGKLRLFFMEKYWEMKRRTNLLPHKVKAFRYQLKIWQEYIALNYTAARKILKKYDKKTDYDLSEKLLQEVSRRTFFASTDIDFIDQKLSRVFPDVPLEQLEFGTKEQRMECVKRLSDEFQIFGFSGDFYSLQMISFYTQRMIRSASEYSCTNYMLFLGVFLYIQLILLYFYDIPLQRASWPLTKFLRQFSAPMVDQISDFIHHNASTGNWLLICLCIVWTNMNDYRWVRLYQFVTVAFIVKSLAKNFIQTPRGFWLWDEGFSNYCGKGFGLPSGHAMVSLAMLSFAFLEFRTPLFLFCILAVQMAVFTNVVYIGTHTFMDVFTGWNFALLLLSFWKFFEGVLDRKSFWLSVALPSVSSVVLADYLESTSHDLENSLHYLPNLMQFCGYSEEKALSRLHLYLNFTNTPFICGLIVSEYLSRKYIREKIELEWLGLYSNVVVCTIGGYMFISFYEFCVNILQFLSISSSYAPYLHNFGSPILVLFAWPMIFSYISTWSNPSKMSLAFAVLSISFVSILK